MSQQILQGPAASSQQPWQRSPAPGPPLCLRQVPARSAREEQAGESEVPASQKKEEECGTFPLGSHLSGLFLHRLLHEAHRQPSSHPPCPPPGEGVLTWMPQRLGRRSSCRPSPLRGSLLLLKGAALLMGFLSFWILLKVVDLSNLNHPHESAAATSHQKHTFSGIDSACFHTGAGDGV